MTQRTRNIIANVLLGVSFLFVVTFLVQHFMTPPRPAWHTDMVWLGLAAATAARIVRGRRWRSYAASE